MISKRFLFFALVCASLLGGLAALGIYFTFKPEPAAQYLVPNKRVSFSRSTDKNIAIPEGLNFVTAAQKTIPIVVHIKVFFDRGGVWTDNEYQRFSSGSGVVVSEDGYILTNNHVIENAKKIEVALEDKRFFVAKIVGTDASTDLALIKIEAFDLAYATFGNSDDLQIGEWVLAVGNPFDLTSTVTAGIVSAKSRNINILEDNDGMTIESFIQTDAAVNPGNSGGALVNLAGDLVGINTAIATKTGGYAGYSFAVPATLAKKVADDLLRFGSVQRALLGVRILEINAQTAQQFGIKAIRGVYVEGISKGSAAETVGMKIGDIILSINEAPVNSVANLQEIIARFRPGDLVKLSFEREGKTYQKQAVLRNQRNEENLPTIISIKELGIEVAIISQEDKIKLGIKNGVKIHKLNTGILKDNGIKAGFIITHIDKIKVNAIEDLKYLLKNKSSGYIVEGYDSNGEKAFFGIGF